VATSSTWSAARVVAVLTTLLLLATVPVALAADSSSGSRAKAAALRSGGDSLEARAHAATLELYALESELARARASLDSLAARRAAVAEERALAQRQLRIARAALRGSQDQLASLVRALYEDPHQGDPLAVLLAAESLDEAIAGLDGLSRAADESSRIIEQARASRVRLGALDRKLAARGAELAELTAAAEARASDLARTASARKSFIARLRAQQRLNAARVAAIEAQAREAGRRAATPAGAPSPSTRTPAAAPAAPATIVPASRPGTLAVMSTGYSIEGRTATGMPTGPGVVAVDPSVIPLGTRITIPGYGVGIAADTGGSVQGSVIDIWFPTQEQALAWGRRVVTITLH
jgi:3D (Asp-Asp-Asp) domain-containing protein/septal ring factor EnvC (AmiA/AmiB activator)